MNKNRTSDEQQFLENLGLKIKKEAKKKGRSMRDIARRTGLSFSGVFAIVWGDNAPNILTLYKICKVLGIDIKDLF